MSEDTTQPIARLWSPDGFRDDGWTHAGSAEALSGNSRIILPLDAFLTLDAETRSASADRIGVHVAPGQELGPLLFHLPTLPLVSLGFPAFNDGRSYSKAVLLRHRHGYRGAIRASGDVLIDQIPLMLRSGFTEFEVTNETALRRLERGVPGWIGNHYQPAVQQERAGAGFSWRRAGGAA